MEDKTATQYPSQYETEVLLKDGSRILLRPIHIEDTERWLSFVNGLSPETKYFRFHYMPKEFTLEDAVRYCTVDYTNTFAFVAEVIRENRKKIVAIGRYYRLPDKKTAEVAFVIEEDYHGKGIGTKLMEWLANVARENGITSFEADVLAENEQMMTVFRDYGFHISSDLEAGAYHVTFPIARTPRVERLEEERERVATLASLRSFMYPRAIAVIGASRQKGSLGQLVFQALMQAGFPGVVYPVNPSADVVMSVKAYPSVLDIPGPLDLAVIVVPARFVSRVADECGRKGVRSLIVISDGFKERGPDGAALERDLRAVTLGHGMRMVGPNCMGMMNTDPESALNASFSLAFPPRGNVAFLSQSGAMGLSILEFVNRYNMGISAFVSVGNSADISANDFLQYWEQDPATRVILLYLESFVQPRRFARIARRVSSTKPIVVIKSGRTSVGVRAASSHTGALATSEVASEALFRQAGITRVDTMGELFDVVALLSSQPLPKGRRVAIVTNGGGPGIIAADACEQRGLLLPELSQAIKDSLKPVIKRDISLHNPLDLTAGASAEEFEGALKVLASDPDNDAVLTIFIPPVVWPMKAMEDAVDRVTPLYRRLNKPLLACFMGQTGVQAKRANSDQFVPRYSFPEDAVVALARAVQYNEMARAPKGSIPKYTGIKRVKARDIIEKVMSRSTTRPIWLDPDHLSELLNCYGIRYAETRVATTPAEATAQAAKVGFPVAVKLHSATITHKTEVGGVILNVKSEAEVKEAYKEIKSRLATKGLEKQMEGVTVQHMVSGGTETIVGITQDPSFGPLVMFGLGGIYAELLKDVAFRLHPLTDLDARKLVHSIKMANLFEGFRGAPPSDTESLEELLLRLSAMVEDIPEIAELDFNPVKVMPKGEGYWVVDARILLR